MNPLFSDKEFKVSVLLMIGNRTIFFFSFNVRDSTKNQIKVIYIFGSIFVKLCVTFSKPK